MDTARSATSSATSGAASSTGSGARLYAIESAAPSRAEAAHRVLKRRLLLGEFPFGHRLGEERLAALLGVSRTPIREALARLHAAGHVQRHPEGGFEPAFPDMGRIGELYEVRKALELTAVQRVIGTDATPAPTAHDRSALLELRRDWAALVDDPGQRADPEFVLVDEDFHMRLALASGNTALAEMLATVNERIRIVRVHDFLTEERIRATVEEHLGILDELLEGSVAQTVARLELHIDESARVASERALNAMIRMLAGRTGATHGG
jgi:DNA-binding GntR family transcriptional regulator